MSSSAGFLRPFKTRILGLLLAILMLSGGWPVQKITAAPGDPPSSPSTKEDGSRLAPGIPVQAADQEDNFGYTWDDSQPPAWFDARTSGTQVAYLTRDDDWYGPIPIGFNFSFYENHYPELYVSTNGYLTFGEGMDEFENSKIPKDTDPNNMVAPFWDDLMLLVDDNGNDISQVFYQFVNKPGNPFFVVEWYHIAKLGNPEDLLTFEVLLYANGDIVFQYETLSGNLSEATVGIEDQHGVDGLFYLFNAPGLDTTKTIHFNRPAPAPRTKVFPVYASGFVFQRNALIEFTVRNTGEAEPQGDRYNLIWKANRSDWNIVFYGPDHRTALVDSDQDGSLDTGPVQPGEDFRVAAAFEAPNSALPGDFVSIQITATSTLAPAEQAMTSLQVAVPAPFTQAFYDSNLGMRLQLVWKENQISQKVSDKQFTGSNLSVIVMPDGNYVYSWEANARNAQNITYTDLDYVVISPIGVLFQDIRPLTSNEAATVKTEDRFLVMEGTADGKIGALWVRILTKTFDVEGLKVQKTNQNVYFAILDTTGQFSLPPVNVTANQEWRGKDDLDIPYFLTPRITLTSDQRFLLAWQDVRQNSDGEVSDIFVASYDLNGTPVTGPTRLTASVAGGLRYGIPCLISAKDQQALIAYSIFDPGSDPSAVDDTSLLAYRVLNSQGVATLAEQEIPGSKGGTVDGIQLKDGTFLLAWKVSDQNLVRFIGLDGLNFQPRYTPKNLTTPKERDASDVSVTQDSLGNAILTWGDAEQSDYLFYALVDSQGQVLTPGMIFSTGQGSAPNINTNSYGLGNAAYEGTWQVMLPLLKH